MSWWEILAWAHDEKFLHGLDPTDQQQCAVTRGRWRLTAAPTGLDSTGTPDCAWVYTHRPTAVSLHFAPCCTARDLTNWHRQAVQFSSHLTHTSRLHLSLRLPSHIVTQSNFCALSAECRLNLYCHIHQATVTSRDFQRMPQHIRDSRFQKNERQTHRLYAMLTRYFRWSTGAQNYNIHRQENVYTMHTEIMFSLYISQLCLIIFLFSN